MVSTGAMRISISSTAGVNIFSADTHISACVTAGVEYLPRLQANHGSAASTSKSFGSVPVVLVVLGSAPFKIFSSVISTIFVDVIYFRVVVWVLHESARHETMHIIGLGLPVDTQTYRLITVPIIM